MENTEIVEVRRKKKLNFGDETRSEMSEQPTSKELAPQE